jgi:hypothetical protein
MSQQDALAKMINIQKQMIDDFAGLCSRLNLVVDVLSGLDEHFNRILFSRMLSFESDGMPRSIPTKQELENALLALGFTPTMTPGHAFWSSIQKGRNPWDTTVP